VHWDESTELKAVDYFMYWQHDGSFQYYPYDKDAHEASGPHEVIYAYCPYENDLIFYDFAKKFGEDFLKELDMDTWNRCRANKWEVMRD